MARWAGSPYLQKPIAGGRTSPPHIIVLMATQWILSRTQPCGTARGERSITFSSEPLDRAFGSGKSNWVLAVYVHRPLTWDEPHPSEITDPAEENAILSRVQTALKSKIGKYELIAHPEWKRNAFQRQVLNCR